jgi:hypothetical protein
VFVATQCLEYAHLHFTVTSCGGPENFYITACLHGSHVLVGLCAQHVKVHCAASLEGGLAVFMASQLIGDVIVTLRRSPWVTGASLCLFVIALLCLWRDNCMMPARIAGSVGNYTAVGSSGRTGDSWLSQALCGYRCGEQLAHWDLKPPGFLWSALG